MWRPWDATATDAVVPEIIEIQDDEDEISFEERDVPTTSTAVAPSRTHLPVEAKQIVRNVYNYVKSTEGEVGAYTKTSKITLVPLSTVKKIVNHDIEPRKARKDKGSSKIFENYHADLIRRIIYEAYENNTVVSLPMLYEKVVNDLNIQCGETSLRCFLRKIGFRISVIDKRQVLMENPRISKWRVDYLNEIEKLREKNTPIFYLDETWFDSHDTVKKGWSDGTRKCTINAPPGRGKRIIILHAGSERGFVDNALLLSAKDVKDAKLDYHDNMTAEVFETWFEKQLLPNLPPNSAIVLDNASYHSAQKRKIPNTNSKKEEIQNFLIEHDLYYEEHYTKKQLIEVLKTREFSKDYKIDAMAKERGFTVVRLPPYHCIFNPIEMVWSQLKGNIRKNNTAPKFSSGTIALIREEVSRIKPETWANCVQHSIKEENKYRERLVKPLIINLDESSDDDSDYFEEM